MTSAIKGLMTGLIDYAGLFPPAGLGMDEAVRRYAEYREGGHAPALGRFIVPATRLEELHETVHRQADAPPDCSWPLSVVLGEVTEDVALRLAESRSRATTASPSSIRVESIEHRVSRPEQISEQLGLISGMLREPGSIEIFFELPLEPDPEPFLAAIADSCGEPASGARVIGRPSAFAKIRTGGVTVDAFPAPESILRFLICCREAGVSFKATAGLHHPLRGLYPLTYEEDSELGTMTGFLNLFLTAAAVHAQIGKKEEWLALLSESRADAFTFAETGIRWKSLTLPLADILAARHGFARSYGSCSFRQPVESLRELAMSCKEA